MTTRTDDTLAVSRWDDAVLAQLGWPVGGRYMRWTWSSLLGPTATQLVILLDEVVTDSGHVTFNYCALAATLGVKPSVLARAIGRLERFHMVRVAGRRVAVRHHVADVPEHLLVRLSPYGLAVHRELTARRLRPVS